MNIGQLIMYLILNSKKSNTEILETVYEKFDPERKGLIKTSPACVAWYKTKLRKEGKLKDERGMKNKVVMSQEELDKMCE